MDVAAAMLRSFEVERMKNITGESRGDNQDTKLRGVNEPVYVY